MRPIDVLPLLTTLLSPSCVRQEIPRSLLALSRGTELIVLDHELKGRLAPRHATGKHFAAELSGAGVSSIKLSCERKLSRGSCDHEHLICSAPDGTALEFPVGRRAPASGRAKVLGTSYTLRGAWHPLEPGRPKSYGFYAAGDAAGQPRAALVTRDDGGLLLIPEHEPKRSLFLLLGNILYESLEPTTERRFTNDRCAR